MKTKKKTVVKRVASKRVVTRKAQSMSMWVVVLAVALVGIVGWKLYTRSFQPQSLDINKVEWNTPQTYELAKWTFDTEADFGASGVWRPINAYYGSGSIVLKEGKVLWPGLIASAQLVAPTVSLDMTEDITGAGSYVVKVKAEVIDQAMSRDASRQLVYTTVPSPSREFSMKMALMTLVKDNKGVNHEKVLAEQSVVALTNQGQKEYEFVVAKPVNQKVTRIRFYLYQPTPQPAVVPERGVRQTTPVVKAQAVMYLDEISVVKRYDARPERVVPSLAPRVDRATPAPRQTKP